MNIDKDALRKAAEAATQEYQEAVAWLMPDTHFTANKKYGEEYGGKALVLKNSAANPATVIALLDEIAALVDDKAALEVDAARYRWLRDYGPEGKPPVMIAGHWYGAKLSSRVGFDLDTAVDAALAAAGSA